MNNESIVIYRLDIQKKTVPVAPELKYKLIHWKPGFKGGFRAKRFPLKYNLFWFYHFFGVFKNKNYSSVLLYDKEVVVAAMLIIPTYYRWPFMKKKDIQFTYVITHPDYRGQGIGKAMILHALNLVKKEDIGKIWYVTDANNTASIKLCESVGFSLVGKGIRKFALNGFVKRLFLEKNDKT